MSSTVLVTILVILAWAVFCLGLISVVGIFLINTIASMLGQDISITMSITNILIGMGVAFVLKLIF